MSELRASDAEREATIERLRTAAGGDVKQDAGERAPAGAARIAKKSPSRTTHPLT